MFHFSHAERAAHLPRPLTLHPLYGDRLHHTFQLAHVTPVLKLWLPLRSHSHADWMGCEKITCCVIFVEMFRSFDYLYVLPKQQSTRTLQHLVLVDDRFNAINSYWACLLCQSLCLVPTGTKVYSRLSLCFWGVHILPGNDSHLQKPPLNISFCPEALELRTVRAKIGGVLVCVTDCDETAFTRYTGNQSHFLIFIFLLDKGCQVWLHIRTSWRSFKKYWSSGQTPWAVVLSVVQRQTALASPGDLL